MTLSNSIGGETWTNTHKTNEHHLTALTRSQDLSQAYVTIFKLAFGGPFSPFNMKESHPNKQNTSFNLKICCLYTQFKPYKHRKHLETQTAGKHYGMASLYMTHKNCFSPLHGSCLWQNDWQGWVVFMWLNPVSFSRGRRGGGSFMTQDNLKPQLGTCPSSSPPPPPLISVTSFNFVKRNPLFSSALTIFL